MIRADHRWGYVVVTIDRPERRNAVDLDTLVELRRAIDEARERQVRALCSPAPGGTFCAGADLDRGGERRLLRRPARPC